MGLDCMCVCIDGGWGDKWSGGLLQCFARAGVMDGELLKGVLNFMELGCAGESCLA